MRKGTVLLTVVVLLLAALAAAVPPPPGATRSAVVPMTAAKDLSGFTFDTDNEGWLQTWIGRPDGTGYDRLYDNVPADFAAGEGQPPGCIMQTVGTDLDQRAYWMGYLGTPAFLGDLHGMWLMMDFYSTGGWRTIADGAGGDDGNVYARWVIAVDDGNGNYDMFVSRRAASVDLNAFTGWTTAAVQLEESNFFRWPNYVWGQYDFSGVLSNYTQVGVYVFSGTDQQSDIDGSSGTWVVLDGVYRLQHYGAYAPGGSASWGLDNLVAVENPVANREATWSRVKSLYR